MRMTLPLHVTILSTLISSLKLRLHTSPSSPLSLLLDLHLLLHRLLVLPTIILFNNWRQLLSSHPEMTPRIEIPRFGVRLNSGFFRLETHKLAPNFEKQA